MKSHTLLQGEIHVIAKEMSQYWRHLKFSPPIPLGQNWHKAFGCRGFNFIQIFYSFCKQVIKAKLLKNLMTFKILFTTKAKSTKVGTKHSLIIFFSNNGPRLFPRGDHNEVVKISWTTFKNLHFQNHWANFNQTWHKASFCGGHSSSFEWKAILLFKGR